jgi:hypothetical protein
MKISLSSITNLCRHTCVSAIACTISLQQAHKFMQKPLASNLSGKSVPNKSFALFLTVVQVLAPAFLDSLASLEPHFRERGLICIPGTG